MVNRHVQMQIMFWVQPILEKVANVNTLTRDVDSMTEDEGGAGIQTEGMFGTELGAGQWGPKPLLLV